MHTTIGRTFGNKRNYPKPKTTKESMNTSTNSLKASETSSVFKLRLDKKKKEIKQSKNKQQVNDCANLLHYQADVFSKELNLSTRSMLSKPD